MSKISLGKVAFTDAGTYSASVSYKRLDFVTTTDSCYLSLVDGNVGNPVTDTSKWKPLALGTQATAAAERANTAAAGAESAQTDTVAATQAAVRATDDIRALETSVGQAEALREQSEVARQEAEDVRSDNEESRKDSETKRETAETDRRSEYEALKKEMQAATEEAWGLSAEVRNVPKIQNGTWWVWDVEADTYVDTNTPATGRSPKIVDGIWWTWDDTAGDYVSTGWAVNSDFSLTKEGIEAVFTGDIVTHTHTHLIYYAQVYDGKPDFAQLTTWMGQDGIEHTFVPGNDIYVADADEPTGYANYKLAATASGTAWVRVPQVPEGYRMVLVKKE